MTSLKRSVPTLMLTAVAASAAGCQGFNPFASPVAGAPATAKTPELTPSSTVIRADVTDIRPTEARPAALVMTPMYDSPPQPITYDTPAPTVAAAPAAAPARWQPTAAPTVTAAGATHTVRAGETLFSIARSTYGDGKQWKKIALANPGLSPSSLRVGQAIIVP